jgi:hydroxyethylthiazole kinase
MHHPQAASRESVAQNAAEILARLRARRPRIHCITNTVAQNFTANALLAAGCLPSMTMSTEEVGSFVSGAQGLLVNLGTFDRERREAIAIAIDAARSNALPWVLDPVFVDRAPTRAAFARELITHRPRVIRLNHAEFSTLAGGKPLPDAVAAYARSGQAVIGLSGESDLVSDGARTVSVANGHPLMARVTAMGCAGSALVVACLATEPDAFVATVAALLIINIAGELAAEKSAGPGSFAASIIDALYNLDGPTLIDRAKVS